MQAPLLTFPSISMIVKPAAHSSDSEVFCRSPFGQGSLLNRSQCLISNPTIVEAFQIILNLSVELWLCQRGSC